MSSSPPTIIIPWARYPTRTKTGRVSKSKRAGRSLPWLSANATNNMRRAVHRSLHAEWREAAVQATLKGRCRLPNTGPYLVAITLYKATANAMDIAAIVEGSKPCIDGIVNAGRLPDDSQEYIAGFAGRWRKRASRDAMRVEVSFLPVPAVLIDLWSSQNS